MATFGERLRELCDERQMTQGMLGEKIGVTNVTVNRWMNGVQMPDEEKLIYLSQYFDVDYFWLLGVGEDREPGLSDEETARFVEEQEHLTYLHMVEVVKDLSPEMQQMIKMSVANAYRIDKEHGRLRSQQKVEECDLL